MTGPRRRGFDAERELARILWSHGFAVIRGPASGAKAKHVTYPDIVALYKGRIFVLEVKYRHSLSQPLYVPLPQVEKLLEFAQRAGGEPLIAVKVPRRGWFLIAIDKAKRTKTALRIDDEILAEALTLEEFITSTINVALTSYMANREEGQPGKLSPQPSGSVRE